MNGRMSEHQFSVINLPGCCQIESETGEKPTLFQWSMVWCVTATRSLGTTLWFACWRQSGRMVTMWLLGLGYLGSSPSPSSHYLCGFGMWLSLTAFEKEGLRMVSTSEV